MILTVGRTYARSSKDGGFTLIEVMVAALLLLVAMAGFVPFFLSGLGQASSVRYKSIATNIAREHMEQIRQLDYREVESYSATETYKRDESATSIPFSVDCMVVEDTASKLKKVTITVAWVGPPKVSAASITTLVYQQFLGPRGAFLEVNPTSSDPLGTPFRMITGSRPTPKTVIVKYHLAESDWGFVYTDLNQPTMAKIPGVYMRLDFVDDQGIRIPVGEADDDNKITNVFIPPPTVGTDGRVKDIWFEYSFDANLIPDGYWEIQATAYNSRNEPGNTWRLRVRVEMGPPAAPTTFVATPQDDNQTVILTWTGGSERDRDHYVLTRYSYHADGSSNTWSTELPALDSEYTDQGSIASAVDPWGLDGSKNSYEYDLYAVDTIGQQGDAAHANTQLPPSVTTTTTTPPTTIPPATTSTSTTTTTLGGYSGIIENTLYTTWSITIKNASGQVVYSGSVGVSTSTTVAGLAKGDFSITATTTGRTVEASFKMPARNGKSILTLR